ncbi:MAG: DUF3592 domain-containing protein [Acidobacteriales bacterium]|nr:DUF3592 domain-containing protein [Terriglobales bacterium]
MFEELYDAMSRLLSWRWPEAVGEVTAVNIERVNAYKNRETFRLAVAYKFSVGMDGPYTGESFWQPAFFVKKRVVGARHKIRVRQQVMVRYRPDDPSINKLDGRAWESL